MAPERWLARTLGALATAVLVTCAVAPPAHAVRVVDYSLEDYPNGVPSFDDSLRLVFAPIGADILVTQEMNPPSSAGQPYVDQFRNNVLNPINPGDWASAPFTNGNDQGNGMFYRTSKFTLLGSWAFYATDVIRLINVYRLKPVGYTSEAAEFRLYVIHLKAGSASTDLSRRLTQATTIRDSMNAMPPGTHAILVGDFNMRSNQEAAFRKFVESQGNNTGRVYDPLNPADAAQTWYSNIAFAAIHTQCPCVTPGTDCSSGFAGGGMDDRFDIFLPTYSLGDGEGLDVLPSTYKPVGNDGQHYNGNIRDGVEIPEGRAYANLLQHSSEHLPDRIDLQLPAKVSLPVSLAFGTVIVGASASQDLSISNPAVAPADELNYTLAADPGFTAPGGAFVLNAGAPAASHAIGMNTGSAGSLSGSVTVTSDAVDNPTVLVPVSGTVLDHAQASLDSTAALFSQSLDFGQHAAGEFPTLMARVHDRDYNSLRARLSLATANITGGDGRFSIVGGFSPALVAGVAATETIQFDDAGATADQDYDATLTFTSADEALSGAQAQPALTVSLHAKMASSSVGVPGGPDLPTLTRLYTPFPNPVFDGTTVHFDLAGEGDVQLSIHDVAGRRVATLARGSFGPGRYHYPWSGRSDGGARLGSGLYFVRLSIAGSPIQIARVALVR